MLIVFSLGVYSPMGSHLYAPRFSVRIITNEVYSGGHGNENHFATHG
jgi:hypothetical protein